MENDPDSFERLEIEGIPAYAACKAVRYTGALLFRTGRADESLPHGGLSHLIEHLALFGLGGRQSYAYNGYVSGLFTVFMATGTHEEVAGFLSHVTHALHDLPFRRLEDEARVLRTEAAGRVRSPAADFLWFRFGATGHGQAVLPEFELVSPEPARIRSWVEQRFTAGNAALWFSGPPPSNLRLELPPGPRLAAPKLIPVPDVTYPSWVFGGPGGIGLSFVRPREDWLTIALVIAVERIGNRLRYERGLTYDVAYDYDPITADVVHAALWAGCLAEHAPAVRDGILVGLDELASAGPTEEEIARMRQGFLRAHEDPESGVQQVAHAAMNELVGYRVRTPAELLRELDALDGKEIGRRIGAAMASALLVLPPGCPPPEDRFNGYPLQSATVVRGRAFRRAEAVFPWSKGPRLIVGEEGVSLVLSEREAQTVHYDSCAAAVAHPNGALEIFGEDGFRVPVEPVRWRGGTEAVRRLLEAIPADRIVHMPEQTHSP